MTAADMTTWVPVVLAFVLVSVEARRLVLGHLRRERWRALLARATVVTLGVPDVFKWHAGMNVSFFLESWRIDYEGRPIRYDPFERASGNVVKIDYLRGKLWVADV